jgi:hypothetical protein
MSLFKKLVHGISMRRAKRVLRKTTSELRRLWDSLPDDAKLRLWLELNRRMTGINPAIDPTSWLAKPSDELLADLVDGLTPGH